MMEDNDQVDAPLITAEPRVRYQARSDIDVLDANNDGSRPPRRRREQLWHTFSMGLSFLVGLIAMSLLVSIWHPRSPSSNRKLPVMHSGIDEKTGQPASWFNGDCGNSVAEARALDCRFNIVLHAWLPRDCISDEDSVDEGLMYADQDWHWGLDNKTGVSLEDVRRGEFARVWTSFDWHVTHCMFVWKRLHRATLAEDIKLDSYTASYGHTKHCIEMVIGHDETRKVAGTQVYAKFPTCA